jgi:hypothetical protein
MEETVDAMLEPYSSAYREVRPGLVRIEVRTLAVKPRRSAVADPRGDYSLVVELEYHLWPLPFLLISFRRRRRHGLEVHAQVHVHLRLLLVQETQIIKPVLHSHEEALHVRGEASELHVRDVEPGEPVRLRRAGGELRRRLRERRDQAGRLLLPLVGHGVVELGEHGVEHRDAVQKILVVVVLQPVEIVVAHDAGARLLLRLEVGHRCRRGRGDRGGRGLVLAASPWLGPRRPRPALEAVEPRGRVGVARRGGAGRRGEADAVVAARERVGRVDGGVAGLAQEGVVGGAVPPRPPTHAAVAGARRARAQRGARRRSGARHFVEHFCSRRLG